MRHLLILLTLMLTTTWVRAEVRSPTFSVPLKIRQANIYLENQRFRDADRLLTSIYASTINTSQERPDRARTVLEMLAQSRSQQGLHETAYALQHQLHQLIAANFSDQGYVYAGSLSRLAEARYREGNVDQAIELAQQAIEIFRALRPVPAESLRVARTNLAQYQIAPFSSAFLPLDLSDFYTRCEQLADPTFASSVDEIMHGYVEVGVDFEPIGPWKIYFNSLKYPSVEKYEGNAERRIYIPKQSNSMMDEVCVIEESDGIVINAMSIID